MESCTTTKNPIRTRTHQADEEESDHGVVLLERGLRLLPPVVELAQVDAQRGAWVVESEAVLRVLAKAGDAGQIWQLK